MSILLGDRKELIVFGRKPRSKWWILFCCGRKAHYRVDGTCKHTQSVLEMVKPEIRDRVKVTGWGGKPPAKGFKPVSVRPTECP